VSVSIPIFYGDVPRSVRASALFPADPEKARVLVGWAVARRLQSPGNRSQDDLVSISKDAAAFTYIKEEVGQREDAGKVVGEVVMTLFAMIANDHDRRSASFESAMHVVENAVVEAGQKTSRSTMSPLLTLMRPSLHLWCAWRLRERRWPSSDAEAGVLVEHAELVRRNLVDWDRGRSVSSEHLKGDCLCPYLGWSPVGAKLYPPRLRRDDVPVRRAAGRPKSRPTKSG
jgi:hypothetical protein